MSAMDSQSSTEVDPDADPLLQLAFTGLDHAIESVEASGGPLIPFVLARTGDELGLRRFVTDRLEDGPVVVEQQLANFAAGATDGADAPPDSVCGAWDGYLNVEGRRTDAVFARAIDRAGSELVIAQRYEMRGLLRKTARRIGNAALLEDTRQQ